MADEDQGLLGKYLPNALGLLGGAGAAKAMMMFPARKPPITAWHASPHKFDKFNLSHIGTGQGAQSYGYGVYSAENPLVAGPGSHYDKEFTLKKLGDSQWWGPSNEDILHQLRQGKTENEILNSLHDWRRNYNPENPTGNDSRLLDKIRAINESKAHIYQVGIDAEPHQLLDWDSPLSKQSQQVQDIIGQHNPQLFKKSWMGSINEPRDINPLTASPYQMNKAGWKWGVPVEHMTGDDFYRWSGDTDIASSAKLNSMGIPGLRYLDQGSRFSIPQAEIDRKIVKHQADLENVNQMLKKPDLYMSDRGVLLGQRMDAEEGIKNLQNSTPLEKATRNYVMFDDSLMSILKKYGIAAPIAGAGAASALNSNQGQSQ